MKKNSRILLAVLLAFIMFSMSACGLLMDDEQYDDYYDGRLDAFDNYEGDRGWNGDHDSYDDFDDYDGYDDYDDSWNGIGDFFSDFFDDGDGDSDSYESCSGDQNNYKNHIDYSSPSDDDDYVYEGNTDYSQYTFGGRLGSAKEMEGTTVVVSVFLNDSETSWDFNRSSDVQYRANALSYMQIAAEWITQQVAAYGTTIQFIYNWKQNTDLYFEGSVSCDMTDEYSDDPYYEQMEWIDRNVDSQSLMDKYGADDIIYMLYLNTPNSNTCVSATYNYAEGDYYPYEVVSIYVHSYNEEEAPAAYAHEILHTYGAPDLYNVDTDGYNYGISRAFVNNQEATSSNDIMYTTYDCYTQEPYYDHISNEFSALDAYYVGVSDDSTEADRWGLDASQHDN